MSAPEPVLRIGAILRELAAKRVEFVVVGGVAVQAHGYIRATADLDIVPRPSMVNLSRLGEALAELDAAAWRTPLPVAVTDPQLLKGAAVVSLATREGRLDLLQLAHVAGAPRSFDELRERALVVQLDEIQVAIAGLDDLIRMKRAAGRAHDLTDIAALTRSDDELEDEAGEST